MASRDDPQPGERCRVVLVEQHPVARGLLADFLGAAGVQVLAATADVADAIDAATSLDPDVTVVDHGLPGRGAAALCRSLADVAPHIPVLIHYAVLTPEDETALRSVPAAALVPKNVRGLELLEAIHEHRR